MSVPTERLVLWAFLYLLGAWIGVSSLVGIGHTYAQMPCADKPAGNLYVAYAWPNDKPAGAYSDPDVDVTTCDAPH